MVDANGNTGNSSWLEVLMDQVKLEALSEAVMNAYRELRIAGDEWRRANERLSSLPAVPSEAEFNKDMGEALNPEDPRRPAEIKSYIKDWANRTAARRAATEAKTLAEEKMKKCGETAHAALEQVVAFIREQS